MKLAINHQAKCRLPVSRLETLLGEALKKNKQEARRLGAETDEISLVTVSLKTMRELNRRLRSKDEPADVLSFYAGGVPAFGGDYGEILICPAVAKKRAVEYHVSLARVIEMLFVHGLLHILGFDHEKAGEKNKMAKAENELLGYEGIVVRSYRLSPSSPKV